MPVIVAALVIFKKGTDKHTNQILGSPSQHERQKLRFAELLITFEEYYQSDLKMIPKLQSKNLSI